LEAMKFANSEFGRRHSLRGLNAKVITSGEIKTGQVIDVISRGKRSD
jgi:hypothetical protein